MKPLAAMVLALAACTTESPTREGEHLTSFVDQRVIPMFVNTQIDVLFVIDSSPAMAPVQEKLAGDYRSMIASIQTSTFGGLPDLHIGVTTTDATDQGRLRLGRFLSNVPRFGWQREANYAGALDDEFVDLAAVGTQGQARVQPIDAALRAISPVVNPGFLRPYARLLVVILAASDDDSTTSIEDARRALTATKVDFTKVFVAVASPREIATPRLDAFISAFAPLGERMSLGDDLTALVDKVGWFLIPLIGYPCFEVPLAEPLDCNAWMQDPASGEELVMPRCTDEITDRCWEKRTDPQNCWLGSHDSIRLHPRFTPFPATLHLECVSQ